jgi:epoxyqueuosine reductase
MYGWQISQEVCPFNNVKFVQITREPAFLPREGLDGPSLIEWLTMTQEEFSARFKGSPIKRAKRRGLLRNVAVALGNWARPRPSPRSRSR